MADTAVGLSEVPELAGLRLGRWARTLGYRGHVSSRSRRYSTTLGALRQVRRDYARAGHREREGIDPAGTGGEDVEVASSWRMVGRGYTPAESLLAQSIALDVQVNRETSRDALLDERQRGGAAAGAGAALPGGRVGPRKARDATGGSGARPGRDTNDSGGDRREAGPGADL